VLSRPMPVTISRDFRGEVLCSALGVGVAMAQARRSSCASRSRSCSESDPQMFIVPSSTGAARATSSPASHQRCAEPVRRQAIHIHIHIDGLPMATGVPSLRALPRADLCRSLTNNRQLSVDFQTPGQPIGRTTATLRVACARTDGPRGVTSAHRDGDRRLRRRLHVPFCS